MFEERAKDAAERHQADLLNIEKIQQYMAIAAGFTGTLLKEAVNKGQLPIAKLRTTKLQLQRTVDEVGYLLRTDRSCYGATSAGIGFQATCQQLMLQLDSLFSQVSQKSGDLNAAYTAQIRCDSNLVGHLRKSTKQLQAYSETMARYRGLFAQDRSAQFPEVQCSEEKGTSA